MAFGQLWWRRRRLLSAILLSTCLILSCTVLPARSLLHQTPRFQFVDIGDTARIRCVSSGNYGDLGISIFWYRARENERPLLLKRCMDEKNADKFICKADGQMLTLEILRAQRNDSGVYLCAQIRFGSLTFSNGSSSLIVGDSYTPDTQVMLLLPATHLENSSQVACVIHAVSGSVQVSWDGPGELQQEAQTLRVKDINGSFTFASVLPMSGVLQRGGENLTCEVRFNLSGSAVRTSAVFPAPSSVDSDRKCLKYAVPTAAVGLLALLGLILSLLWIRIYPSRLGVQPRVSEPPSPEISQEGICYAQLDFPSRTLDDNQRNRAPYGRKQKTRMT